MAGVACARGPDDVRLWAVARRAQENHGNGRMVPTGLQRCSEAPWVFNFQQATSSPSLHAEFLPKLPCIFL